jgi:iron complex outermembrane recepter protein
MRASPRILTRSIAILLGGIASAVAQQSASTASLNRPAVDALGSTTRLGEVVVTGEGAASYLPETQPSGTRLDIPARELTQTVSTVTRKEIEDRGVTTVQQAIETMPGVRPVSGVYSSTEATAGIRSRGFENDFTLVNGNRIQAFGFPIELATVDRLEVVKGPAGVLFGQMDPGGTLNIVTKRPLRDPRHEVEVTVGSFDFYRVRIDSTGPLYSRDVLTDMMDPKGGSKGMLAANERQPVLLYRFNAAYETGNSYRDYVDHQRYVVAPALTWFIGPDTTLDVEFQYLWEEYRFDRGLAPRPITLRLPRSRFVGEPDMPRSWTQNYSVFWSGEHRFNEDWKLRQGGAFFYQNGRSYEISAFSPVTGDGDDGLFDRFASKAWAENKYLTLQLELHGQFETGAIGHKTMLGGEYSYVNFGYGFFSPRDPIPPLNVRDPQYGRFSFRPPYTASYNAEGYGDETWALYFDHQISLAPNLKVALGSRFDWFNAFYEDRVEDVDRTAPNGFGWSPRAGVVWSPLPSTDLYANWARTFQPNLFADALGNVFDPEEGEAFEAGVRQRFFGDQLQATAAVFQITKQNVLGPDPSDPTGQAQRVSGEERSRGLEFELRGRPLPGWDVAAAYAYIDAEVTESSFEPVGAALVDIPHNQFSLYTQYELQSGPLKGLFAGYGFFYVGERRSSFANAAFELPAHTRHDATLGYKRDRWRAQVNFENIGNELYYETHGNNIFPQAPFNVKASLSYTF